MSMDTQQIFVAGLRKLFESRNRILQGDNKRLTWAEIAHAANLSPGNLSGFLTFKRNYSESKRTQLANFFGKTYMEVMDIGQKELSERLNILTRRPTRIRPIDHSNDAFGPNLIDVTNVLQDIWNYGQIGQAEKVVDAINNIIEGTSPKLDLSTERHRKAIDQFQNKPLALEINEELAKLEKLDAGQPKEILGIIKDRNFRLEQEAAKKRAAASGEG